MKKLLALILCVMMFVAVIPTSAFATAPTAAEPALEKIPGKATDKNTSVVEDVDGWTGKSKDAKVSAYNNAVKAAQAQVEYMAGALAANEAVYATAKATDSLTGGILDAVEEMLDKDLSKDFGGDLRNVTKAAIGDAIYAYMTKHVSDTQSTVKLYNPSTGKFDAAKKIVDPVKYAQVFADAVTDAFDNAAAQKSLEAFVYAAAAKSFADDAKTAYEEYLDKATDFSGWANYIAYGIPAFDPNPNAMLDLDDNASDANPEWTISAPPQS